MDLKTFLLYAWLTVATSSGLAFSGCGSTEISGGGGGGDEDGDQYVAYGPPPCTTTAQCVESLGKGWYCDANKVCADGNESSGEGDRDKAEADEELATLYGPQVCNSDQQCRDWHGQGWYCPDRTGGQWDNDGCVQGEGDTDQEKAENDAEYGEMEVLYGPASCSSDQQCINEHGAGWYCSYQFGQGPFYDGCIQGGGDGDGADTDPADIEQADGELTDQDADDMQVAYGPPPCYSDDLCHTWFGPDWYCDGNHICQPGESESEADQDSDEGTVVLYGPPPCSTDQECVNQHGAGWVCNGSHVCEPGETESEAADQDADDTPVVLYGPQASCSTDQWCIDQHGKGWACATPGSGNPDGCVLAGDADNDGDPADQIVVDYGPHGCAPGGATPEAAAPKWYDEK